MQFEADIPEDFFPPDVLDLQDGLVFDRPIDLVGDDQLLADDHLDDVILGDVRHLPLAIDPAVAQNDVLVAELEYLIEEVRDVDDCLAFLLHPLDQLEEDAFLLQAQ